MRRPILFAAIVVLTVVSLGAQPRLDLPGTLYWVEGLEDGYSFCKMDLLDLSITELGRYSGGRISSASWSPDFTRAAFEFEGEDWEAEILVMDFATGEVSRLTTNTWDDSDPAWSPDGRFIAYVSERRDAPGLYVMGADGRGSRRIVSGRVYSPSWSPDGTRILFAAVPFRLNPGQAMEEAYFSGLAFPSGLNSRAPQDSAPASRASNIFVVRFQGGPKPSPALLSSSPIWGEEYRLLTNEGNLYDPAWSPDGTRIAVSRRALLSGISLMDPDGESLRECQVGPFSRPVVLIQPCWSPDSRFIACIRKVGAESSIWVFEVGGRAEAEQLTPAEVNRFGVGWGM